MRRALSITVIAIFIMLLLIFPARSITGASAGILLWYKKVLPVLLPFALASHLMIETNLTGRLPPRIYVILMGFLCGYPMGALLIGTLTREGRIDKAEGQRLLLFCNQPSPMFLTGYLGIQCLSLENTLPVILAAYGPPILLGALLCLKKPVRNSNEDTVFKPLSITLFEKAWLDSCLIVVKIGGYMLFFSLVASWLEQLIAGGTLVRPLLIGFCEMTTGTGLLADTALPPTIKAAAGVLLVSFGGLSCTAQAAGCLTGSGLKIRTYAVVKFLCGLISAGICYIILSR